MSSSSDFSLVSSETALPAGCCYGIELTAETGYYPVAGRPQAWRLRVTVTRWSNVDPNIFLYRLHDTDPETGEPFASFECVTSPVDLEEYPVGAPLEGENAHPYFRLAEIDLLFRNEDLMDRTWEALKQDRDELIRTLTQLCELQVAGTDPAGCFEAESSDAVSSDAVESSTEPTPSSSAVCPDTGLGCLRIEQSDDPRFPAGLLLEEISAPGDGPAFIRTFSVGSPSAVAGLLVTLSLAEHNMTFVIEDGAGHAASDFTVGMSDEYKAVFRYSFAETGEEHTLWIGGLVACPSSSSSSSSLSP